MGATSSPKFPYPNGAAGAEPADPVAGQPGHFAWSIWVKQFLKNLNLESVKRSGDTMTGHLTIPQVPTEPNHAASKAYVDSNIGGGGGGGGVPVGPNAPTDPSVVVWIDTSV